MPIENITRTFYIWRMSSPLLTRTRPHRTDRPGQPLLGDLTLVRARVHEACGNARRTLALMLAARTEGDIFWIAPAWEPAQLNPDGIRAIVEPSRLTFITPQRPEDLLWCMEECLRPGAMSLVVADIPGLPHLTPVRRLHLAAETGAAEGRITPLGLLLTPGDGGAQGVESRWRLNGAHKPGDPGWHLTRLRARTEPPADWRVTPRPDPEWPDLPSLSHGFELTQLPTD